MMDDLISRRDAINVVSEITTTMSVCTNKDECYGMKRMQKQAITELENMPSAEPKAISEWKKEFREYVDSLDIARDDWKGIIEYIDELPSAQPDVIRCKDCYYNDGTAYCELHFRDVKAKDFCSWAERREDATD